MAYKLKSTADAPQRTPYQFVVFVFLSVLAGWTLLRAVLILRYVPPPHFTPEIGQLLVCGLAGDFLAALILILPVVGWFLIVPQRWYIERWQRFFFWCFASLVAVIHVTLLAAEYYFFSEFQKRFDGA